MTFLELCQALRREVGAPGNGPANVENQTGEYARLVSWIANEWHSIQQRHERWRFAWTRGTVELSSEFTEFSLPKDLAALDPNSLRIGDKSVQLIHWEDFENRALIFQTNPVPNIAAISPDGVLHFESHPEPGSDLSLSYWKTPQRLVNNTDVPRCPDRFQYTIVYAAMIQYGLYENAPEVVEQGRYNFDRAYQEMVNRELPDVTMAGPLA